jgi:hypothetical protein
MNLAALRTSSPVVNLLKKGNTVSLMKPINELKIILLSATYKN